jgi:hypothetical protein
MEAYTNMSDDNMIRLLDLLVEAGELELAAGVANYERVEVLNVEDFNGREHAVLVRALSKLES